MAWKQGFVWVVIKPPFRSKSDVVITRSPPSGARVVSGPSSAYKTIQEIGGKTKPRVLSVDIGAFDVTVRPHHQRIAFRRDTRKTTSALTVKGVRMT